MAIGWTRNNTKRRQLYDAISKQTQEHGINLQEFYDNPSYFAKSGSGTPVALQGSHPNLVHWPLPEYKGGSALRRELTIFCKRIDSLLAGTGIQWIDPGHWHSTVFSAVHSSDPIVISRIGADISQIVRFEVPKTKPYVLSFTRLIVTHDGGVLAVGYPGNGQLDALRARLLKSLPGSIVSHMVHVTLGHFTHPIPVNATTKLNNLVQAFREDDKVIGEVTVDFLTYAMYHGPFIKMRLEEISTVRFRSHYSQC